jgi:hypothetical protein
VTQTAYLEILLNDTGYSTRLRRNDFLSAQLHRSIRDLDQLRIGEASKMIGLLKEIKLEQRMAAQGKDDRGRPLNQEDCR